MEYRQLGRSGLRVSRLTLGTMTFGGRGQFRHVGDTDLDGARRQIDMALDAGVNLIDTADVYSRGRPRRSSAQALGRARRDKVLLATKARFPMGAGPERRGPLAPPPHRGLRGQPAATADRPHRSLPGPRVGWADAARGDARRARPSPAERQGPLRRVLELRRLAGDEGARDRARERGCPQFVSQQVYLSLQERSAEYEIVPSALDQGLGLLIWSPLAGGLLSGKYRRGQPPPPGSRHAERVERAAGLRRGQALRHGRDAGRDRRRSRRVRGPGRARLAARAARRHDASSSARAPTSSSRTTWPRRTSS